MKRDSRVGQSEALTDECTAGHSESCVVAFLMQRERSTCFALDFSGAEDLGTAMEAFDTRQVFNV
jgi:hypothetical protein